MLGDSERTVGRAWMLLCALRPEHFTGELEALVAGLERADADEQAWWRALRDQVDPTPAQLAAALLGHSIAVEQAHRHRQQEREKKAREEEKKRRARREQREARNRAAVIGAGILGILIVLLSIPKMFPDLFASRDPIQTLVGGTILMGFVVGGVLGAREDHALGGALAGGFVVFVLWVLLWAAWTTIWGLPTPSEIGAVVSSAVGQSG